MFRSLDDAKMYLDDQGLDDLAGELLPLLRPCVRLMPGSVDRTGGTRTGGQPDLPPGMDWPMRPRPADADAFIAKWPTHGDWIAKHVLQDQSFEFVAQIDLAEAAGQPIAAALPADGRLLFFYDGSIGPWLDGAKACRVLWDRSPLETLNPCAIPIDLAGLLGAERAEWDRRQADPMSMAKDFSPPVLDVIRDNLPPGTTLEEHFADIAASMTFSSRYVHPSIAMQLEPALQWPDSSSPEATADPVLSAIYAGDGLSAMTLSRPDHIAFCHLLIGVPIPEQDDPRYSAVVSNDPALAARRDAEWAEIWPDVEKQGADWVLLLQIEQSALMQQRLAEGCVYFLIHKDALMARDFGKVQAIYQQT